ncbi:MAG: excinuclease ABC subunit UvrA [Firmicutes bacterium]|nr:excinuclease ABC subunit UvrA [Bacillota bacterium]
MLENIVIRGASENNLKNIDVTIPRNKLVVLTGVSGSGKSSLAFGTIFAEGQRRFMESLSSYARQFLGQTSKPRVDSIEGLSPAISIDQKTTSHNPRSTVGTVTEIYDYLRLLYARVGEAHCPTCDKKISRQSVDQIAEQIFKNYTGKLVMIEAPVIRGQKGRFEKELDSYKRSGFVRVKINGSVYMLDEEITLDKNIRHNISIVVDRITVSEDEKTRINEAVETALRVANGLVSIVSVNNGKQMVNEGQVVGAKQIDSPVTGEEEVERSMLFSNKYACVECGINIEELEPRSFSFNSPFGACSNCSGLGFTLEIDESRIIPNKDLSIAEGAIVASGWNMESGKVAQMLLSAFVKKFGVSLTQSISSMKPEIVQKLLHGCEEKLDYNYTGAISWDNPYQGNWEGIIGNLKRRYRETTSEWMKQEISKLMINSKCSVCSGRRLRKEALAVRVGGGGQADTVRGRGLNIAELTSLSVKDTVSFFENLKLEGNNAEIAKPIIKEIKARCQFLVDVGLHYLTLARNSDSLSGGESQRIRLATQIGSGLVGVLYILDEPSIGLHQRDNQKLLNTLFKLRDLGNSLIVVEHDEETIMAADFVVDIGPMAGKHGGELVFAGTPEELAECERSLTGFYLKDAYNTQHIRESRDPLPFQVGDRGWFEVRGAAENNLKNVDARFPVGVLTSVTGVSGSGKSSLVNKILYPALYNILNRTEQSSHKVTRRVGRHEELIGAEYFDKIIEINQQPIGRTPRSNAATYTDMFGHIRDLFAATRDAKERGFEKGRFSFNVRGGRCDHCEGDGVRKIEMHFLPDVYVQCEVCKGRRFNSETLDVRFKGKNIFDVLEMTVDEAVDFFQHIPQIYKKVKTLQDVGLGYIKLGQPATTLSGGEAQRIKLATELTKSSTGKTIYILDEPTTGLHSYDVQKLIAILGRLVDNGNTVVVIEHNLDVIRVSDYVIDLGPEGGDEGGQIVAVGSPAEVAKNETSVTGRFL